MNFKLIKDNNHKNIDCTQKDLDKKLKSSKRLVKQILGCTLAISISIFGIYVVYNICDSISDFICTMCIPEKRQNFIYMAKERFNVDQAFPDEKNELMIEAQDIIKTNFDDRQLQNYYNNIVDFKYYYNPNDNMINNNNSIIAYYNICDNRIVEIKYNDRAFLHEFTHLISSDATQGFVKNNLGSGITEGYTEYFNVKYFSEIMHDEYKTGYKSEFAFAHLLSSIIGSDKMNEAFLTNNQDMLVNELVKLYGTEEDAYKFIESVDEVTRSKTPAEYKNNSKLAFDNILNYYLGKIIKDIKFSDDGVNIKLKGEKHYFDLLSCGYNIGLNGIEINNILKDKIFDYCINERDKYKYSNSKILEQFIENYVMDYEEYHEDDCQKVKKYQKQ